MEHTDNTVLHTAASTPPLTEETPPTVGRAATPTAGAPAETAVSAGSAETPARAAEPSGKAAPARIDRRGRVLSGRAWALVTGAGTGIGRSFALRLATAGYDLVLVGQTTATLERVRDEIAAADATARRQVRILTMDLARTEASDELYATVRAMGIDVDVLVNNAGIFSFRDILQTPPERIERMILLHDMTLSKNCLAFGRDMAARGRGWILNMSSFSIWMPFPGMALYTATKAYVRTFSVAFAKEMAERGVRVTAVCPAGVATDLYGLTPRWQRIGLRLGVLISADACARRALRALWRGRRTVVPDWWNRAFIPLCKLLPMWLIRPLRRHTMQFQK